LKLSKDILYKNTRAARFWDLDVFLGSINNRDYYLVFKGKHLSHDGIIEVMNSMEFYHYYFDDFRMNVWLAVAIEKAKKLLILK
jgi:hypothetical protein